MATPREPDQADAKLRELGFDLKAPPEQALETLRSLRGRPGVAEAAIARALGNLRTPAAADLLAEMESHASGLERREIRRSLFKLRQRGFEPSDAAPPSEPPRPAAPSDSGLSALLSGFDDEGARVVWIFKPRVQGGLNRLSGLTSESEGLVDARVVALSRREQREERAELERRSGLKLIEVDWRLADFILCEAYRRTPEARRGPVGDFVTARAELITAALPPPDFIHPVYGALLAEPAEPSVELLKQPEISRWALTAEEIRPYLEQINELEQSPLVLNQLQQQDRLEAVLERAVSELFSGERGRRMRRRLEDTAYYLALTGRKEPARRAAAAAAAIRDGADLKRVAFFRSFIRAQLGAMLAEEQERAKEEPHLIVTPAEAMRASQSRARSR